MNPSDLPDVQSPLVDLSVIESNPSNIPLNPPPVIPSPELWENLQGLEQFKFSRGMQPLLQDIPDTHTRKPHSRKALMSPQYGMQESKGHSCLIYARPALLCRELRRYFEAKVAAPRSTSAIILVPHWKCAEFWPLVSHLQVLRTIPIGTTVFCRGGRPVSTPYEVVVFSDPVQTDGQACRQYPLSLYSLTPTHTRLTFLLEGQFMGQMARILLDTGATDNFVSDRFDLPPALNTAKPVQVRLGDGSRAASLRTVRSLVKLGRGLNTQGVFHVLTLSDQFDVVLGCGFLRDHRAVLDFGTGQLVLLHDGMLHKVHTSAYTPPDPDPNMTDPNPNGNPKTEESTALKTDAQVVAFSDNDGLVLSAMGAFRQLQFNSTLVNADELQPVLMLLHRVEHTPVQLGQIEVHDSVADRYQTALAQLLDKYGDVFTDKLETLPPIMEGWHSIPLVAGSSAPNQRPYRMAPAMRAELERAVQEGLKSGRITPSTSEFGAPVLFVPKPDGSWRMVIDYRALNKITVRNKYPLPRIDDILDGLAQSRVFSSLDLTEGYHQIRLTPEDCPKTAFRTAVGLYEYKVLPMGLCNAPATFQRIVNTIFQEELLEGFLNIYLDDILIHSTDPESHLKHLERVLIRLRQTGLKAKRKKCEFMLRELKFLGYLVGQGTLKPNPEKVSTVSNWPRPVTKTDVRAFLGLCGFFRFVEQYAAIAKPLTTLTGNAYTNPIPWNPAAEHAFQTLKQRWIEAPILSLPDFKLPFEIEVDASGFALGAILMQNGSVVAYESRQLLPAEINYPAGER